MRRLLPVLLVSLVACATSPRYDYRKEPDPFLAEYVIGASDQLSIRVWKNPDVSSEVTVRPDGTITLPLIGDLLAVGRTPSRLQEEITKQLGHYLKGEGLVVSVAVAAANSYTFTVSGHVERPGVFSSPRYVTVLEAMQLAGGPNRFASPGGTRLFRRVSRSGAATRTIPIDYPRVVDGSQPEANLVLLPGDQLYVP
jgi:polysaccharide export outer membrane protein